MKIPQQKTAVHTEMEGTKRSGSPDVLLSIIIPAWNCENYLEECLNSVLTQLPDDYELIVVDDGSTDRTPEPLRNIRERGIICTSVFVYTKEPQVPGIQDWVWQRENTQLSWIVMIAFGKAFSLQAGRFWKVRRILSFSG